MLQTFLGESIASNRRFPVANHYEQDVLRSPESTDCMLLALPSISNLWSISGALGARGRNLSHLGLGTSIRFTSWERPTHKCYKDKTKAQTPPHVNSQTESRKPAHEKITPIPSTKFPGDVRVLPGTSVTEQL